MGADQNLDWAAAAASALDWWRDAGVDVLVADEPLRWLEAPPPAPTPAIAPATAAPAPDVLPDTLEAFAAWRLGEGAPDAGWGGVPIAASGPAGATVMILVDCPERDDRDVLMEGPVGRLFDRMLAAIGLDRAQVALAAVCARRPTTGRVPRDIEARLGTIARHHVELVAPKRLLAMGDAASRAILSMNVADARGRYHPLNHRNGTVTEVVATHHPRFLLDRPAAKTEAWRDLLMLTQEQRS
ncbi:uracil-DNA glycosylase family protein [uncultured Sphingomonas sp.]|uniref:uracil-DNA glycosylase family protein n=1 Tax=uncultured Sphingomonas sp. TaxID=158754 RepID=UPI002583E0EE|nr:uracil-DNA glycosylase family protein [uncultured Sphingomonas sp.]